MTGLKKSNATSDWEIWKMARLWPRPRSQCTNQQLTSNWSPAGPIAANPKRVLWSESFCDLNVFDDWNVTKTKMYLFLIIDLLLLTLPFTFVSLWVFSWSHPPFFAGVQNIPHHCSNIVRLQSRYKRFRGKVLSSSWSSSAFIQLRRSGLVRIVSLIDRCPTILLALRRRFQEAFVEALVWRDLTLPILSMAFTAPRLCVTGAPAQTFAPLR